MIINFNFKISESLVTFETIKHIFHWHAQYPDFNKKQWMMGHINFWVLINFELEITTRWKTKDVVTQIFLFSYTCILYGSIFLFFRIKHHLSLICERFLLIQTTSDLNWQLKSSILKNKRVLVCNIFSHKKDAIVG